MDESQIVKARKDKLVKIVKNNFNWIVYLILAVIVFLAVKIRTRNLSGLRDITTGTWTLGPDLDPFLFLRWAKYIVANGHLMVIDNMRYIPLGFKTSGELILHPYMIAWFHKLAVLFGSESVTQSAALYPVFFFAITVIAFFFLVKKIFLDFVDKKSANIIALISCFFLSVIPVLLPRTIAGIPEKESAAFFFLFMSFYFFICSWKAKTNKLGYAYSLLAGVFTAGMALVWGGYAFIFLTLALAVTISFVFGQIDNKRYYYSLIFMLSSFLIMHIFSTRYSFYNLFTSLETGSFVLSMVFIGVNLVLTKTFLKKYIKHPKLVKIPSPIISILVSIILGLVLIMIFFGPSFVTNKAAVVIHNLVSPANTRIISTVAENRQPYYTEWANSFGPYVAGVPILFWMFFIGSIFLFVHLLKKFNKKEKWYLGIGYVVFLSSIVFSRYSSKSLFNGENFASLFVYFTGTLLFLIIIGFYYYKNYNNDKREKFSEIDFNLIILFSFFVLSILSARGAVRLILILVPTASIMVSYLTVILVSKVRTPDKDDFNKYLGWTITVVVVVAVIFAGWQLYIGINSSAESYVPGIYNQQWQSAMSWVRENTPPDAVFGHWWDYGYWIQSIGERATVLDGGNAISYWNHLMGRHALTSTSSTDALEFLYAHNTTHFLIDSTDIGKYTAFATIGSDADYDRRSWINSFFSDDSNAQETKNGTMRFYSGGFTLDEDITYVIDGEKIFLPGVGNKDLNKINNNIAGVGGILIEFVNGKAQQPVAIFVYRGKQYNIPLRYAYDGELVDYESGIDAGVFLMPRIVQNGGSTAVQKNGALFYLSGRVVHSQLARLYLYGEDVPGFKLEHVEQDYVVKGINPQINNSGDFLYYGGFRGPIKIWKMEYPQDIVYRPEYLNTVYPEDIRFV